MAQSTFSDETLMAFADGQLEEPDFSAVAAALETDAELSQRVEALVAGRDFARALYRPLRQQPVPAQLRQSVEAAIARAMGGDVVPIGARRSSRMAGWVPVAVAACMAIFVAGPLGFFAGRTGIPPATAPVVGSALEGELAALVAMLPSGEERTLADGSKLRPVATFADGAGHLCREFEIEHATAIIAVACQEADHWETMFAVATASSEGYVPASSLDALDSYLLAIGAGVPYSMDAERAALEGD